MEGGELADADPHMTTVSRHHFRDDSDQDFSISIIEVPFFTRIPKKEKLFSSFLDRFFKLRIYQMMYLCYGF